jgi:dTDP-4-amino-4,6-dideoxygalactose transaminase
MKVEFYKHNLDDRDKQECLKVLDSIFLTTGEWTKNFEQKFATYTKHKYVVGTTSCTTSLELALRYFGIGPGDEVITTPMSFVATSNAIEIVGARPVYVDVEESTGNINAELIEVAITDRTRAIIPVHLYGQLCDMKKIRALANKHNLKIIEDAVHCIEGSRDGVRAGELGDAACYSFYTTKSITCGEGGALACNSEEMYQWLSKARLHGINKGAADRYGKKYQHYDMDFLGRKFNMSNILAALLINQVDRIDELLKKKEFIAQMLNNGFGQNPYITLPAVLPNTVHGRHIYTIWVNPEKRDEYLSQIQDAGIGVGINYRAIHLMKYYREKYGYDKGAFSIAEKIGDSTITLPFYPKLDPEEIKYMINTLNNIITC